MGFSISKENIAKGLNTLNTFNSTEGNGTTRVLFTDESARVYKITYARVRIDCYGRRNRKYIRYT